MSEPYLKDKGWGPIAWKSLEEIIDREEDFRPIELLEKAEEALKEAGYSVNHTLKHLDEFIDPSVYLEDDSLSEEELEALFEEPTGGKRDAESIRESNEHYWYTTVREMMVGYSYASQAMDLIKAVCERLKIQPEILTQEEIDAGY